MKYLIFAIALFSITLTSAYAETKEKYVINSEKSTLRWEGAKMTGTHWGYVNIKSGFLGLKSGKWSGEFIIDMKSIKDMDLEDKESNGNLAGHLKSDDFFSAEKYPEAKLKITGIHARKKAGATHTVSGDLTIKGKTHKINFPAVINFNGDEMSATAKFSIDRSKWNIRYGSKSFFKSIGDKAIDNEMKFEVKLVGNKESLNS